MLFKLKLNTADKVSGTSYNAFIPINTGIIADKIVYGKLELTTPLSSSNLESIFIACNDVSQEQAYDSNTSLTNAFLGEVPLICVNTNTSMYFYQATAHSNDKFQISSPMALKSGTVNLRLTDAYGNLLTNFTSDYSVVLSFWDDN